LRSGSGELIGGGRGVPDGSGELIGGGRGVPGGSGEPIGGGRGVPDGSGELIGSGRGAPDGSGELIGGGRGAPDGSGELIGGGRGVPDGSGEPIGGGRSAPDDSGERSGKEGGMVAPSAFDVRLASARMIAPAVRHLVFERVDGEVFDFAPGQWVNLLMPLPSGEIKRSYSIASAPSGAPSFELAITRVQGGPGSEFLHSIEENTVLRAVGPQGLFTREAADTAPSLFVATGTGVAPFRSMLHAALAAGSAAPMWILFGARFEEDILYRAEFEALAAKHSNVRFDVTLSRPGGGWAGRSGYVQRHVPELLAELERAANGVAPHVYACGLDRMVSSVKDLCRKELGVDRKRVHVERYD
jgi:ferredoxin-NADP reductase